MKRRSVFHFPIGWALDGATPFARFMGRLFRRVTRLHVWLYRHSGGLVGGWLPFRGRVLILATVGRRTGLVRSVPLVYELVDGRIYVCGGSGGSQRQPYWLLNLRTNPRATVQILGKCQEVEARELSGAAYTAVADQLKKRRSAMLKYQRAASRRIPIVHLQRVR